jgi:phosphoglycerol transferase MdoB-like AlkP superfamily enzyme
MKISRVSIVSFIALVLTAIALIPAGAHVFEMSGKMKLGRDAYFVVQGLYRGWAYFGFAYVGAFLACLARAVLPGSRRDRLLAAFAALMIAAALAAFFFFVYPANQITKDWTATPANWKNWRLQWEWGQAAVAACTFAAFASLAWPASGKQ